MLFSDLLSPERVYADVRASSKKKLLEKISEHLAQYDENMDAREIFESLCAREHLGSTALGEGVAIPHGRVPGCVNVQAVFMRLNKALPFDALDGKPVDLLLALVVPENCTGDHLKLLATVAEQFSNNDLLEKLRDTQDSFQLFDLLCSAQH